MPLLDADIAPKPVLEKKTEPLRIALALGIAAVGLAIGLAFLFAPKQAKKAVRQVVQAAEALVQKVPAAAKEEKQEDESAPVTFSKRKRPDYAARPDEPRAFAGRPRPSPTHAVTPQRRPFRHADLPLGTARLKVRELLGEPDLAVYMLEKDHVVEHFVYVNRAQSYATSVLIVDGRVASVYTGMPSVWTGASAIRAGRESPLPN